MNVTVAMDSFKGSLTSLEAGQAVREGVLLAMPEARVTVRPLADGGEGTVAALTPGLGGRTVRARVTGPLGRPVECVYGVVGSTGTAILEISGAAGLSLVPEAERDPMMTTTRGVGEIILDAMGRGCRRFIVGIGGSATNDGGAGMLQALGFGLLNARGKQIPPGARGLRELAKITREGAAPELADCTFQIACDVTNPLCGRLGASAVFAPQKGAAPEDIPAMDRWLSAYADLAERAAPGADRNLPGSGAAGGLGFAFRTFLSAALCSGVDLVLRETRLEDYIRDADILVTGEGRLDGQTLMGKAPIGAARTAKSHGKPVLALSGTAAPDARACNAAGIDAYFPILQDTVTLPKALSPTTARRCLTATSEQAFRLIRTIREWPRGQCGQADNPSGV